MERQEVTRASVSSACVLVRLRRRRIAGGICSLRSGRKKIGVSIVVSPAAEYIRMLSDPSRINGIKRKGMRAKQEGTALVKRNDYATYSMVDVLLIPEYKLVLEKGKFNEFQAHYNIRTDPNLGLRWAAICWVAWGCAYEEANNWQICELVASMPEDERCARELNKCVLNAMEVHISLMIREGEVGVVVATDEAAMGYYVVKWLSKPYSL